MKNKLSTGLAMAAALLASGSAFADDHHADAKASAKSAGHHETVAVHHGGGSTHAVAVHHGGGSTHSVAVHHGGNAQVAVHHGGGSTHVVTASHPANRAYTTTSHHSTTAVTESRNTNYNHASYNRGNYHNGGHGTYAFASHSGWNHNRDYNWNGNHYRWYNNAWYIVPVGFVAGGPAYYGSGYSGGGNVGAQVQAALSRQGYYQGPIDGVVGPGTRSAIAAYQQDNGLSVTGTITSGLLNTLGV